MSNDSVRFVALLDALDARRVELIEALGDLEGATAMTREAFLSGTPISGIHADGRFLASRRQISECLTRMNSALMACRAEGIRALVDDEGHSLSEVSRMVGSSRQFVTRLYRRAVEGSATRGGGVVVELSAD